MPAGNLEKITLKVEGMSCNHCVQAMEKAVCEAGGTDATVDLAGKTITISYDKTKVTPNRLKKAIEEQGYDIVE
jgi:copper chaperone